MSLSICCVNVRGVRQAEKRRDVFHYLRKLCCGVYCIVDTHFTADMETLIHSEWGGNVYLSCGTANARGVAVLLNPSAAVIVHKVDVDVFGNFVVLDMEFDGYFRCICVVLYGPNEDCPSFYETLLSKMDDSGTYPVILVGDWNLVLDLEKDTKFYRGIGNPKARQVVLDAMDNRNLIDVWRLQHLDLRRSPGGGLILLNSLGLIFLSFLRSFWIELLLQIF